MTTFNKGIRTQAGKDLANRVMAGKTSITYSRLVFSSEDLSDKSDDELSELTDVEPQELAVEPDTIDLKATDVTDPETEVRAIAKNDPLTAGLHVRTYGLYAKDDSGNEILFGVALDDNPAYLPPHESGDQDQYLTYEWDTALKDTDNIKFTNTKMVFVNFDELNRYKSAVNATVASLEADDNSLSGSTKADYANAAGSVSSLQDSAASYTDYRTGSVMNQANANVETNRVSLSNSVNGLPHWNDINYTRSNVAPSLANSALNAANGFTYNKATSIDGQLNDKQTQLNSTIDSARERDNGLQGQITANYSANVASENNLQDQINTNRASIAANAGMFKTPSEYFSSQTLDLDKYKDTGVYSLFMPHVVHGPSDSYDKEQPWGWLMVANEGDTVTQILYTTTDQTHFYYRMGSGPGTNLGGWYYNVNETDEDYTRTNLIPSGAASAVSVAHGYTDQRANEISNSASFSASSVLNQADMNMETNRINLQNQVTGNNNAHNATESNLQQQVTNNYNTMLAGRDIFKNPSERFHDDRIDLDKCKTTGVYGLFIPNLIHAPTDYGDNEPWGWLLVANEGDVVTQILYSSVDDNHFYYRLATGNNLSWGWWFHNVSQYDEEHTRNDLIPSAENAAVQQANTNTTNAMNQANAFATGKAQDALNQANTNMETNRVNLQNEINATNTSINDANNSIISHEDMFKYPEQHFGNDTLDLDNMKSTGCFSLFMPHVVHGPTITYSGSPQPWGWLVVLNEGDTVTQILYTTADDGNMFYRLGSGPGMSFGWWYSSGVSRAGNEDDARNKSQQNPGLLFIYPD